MLETVGRVTGATVSAAVGFVAGDADTLYVAAGSDSADWALNLHANPVCRVLIGESAAAYEASEADGDERAAALVRMVLKYGTPAERLGRGPVFRLTPVRA